jgi:hypothetical protein
MAAAPSEDLVSAVRAGLSRYSERFGEAAGAVLCHESDLPVLEKAGLKVDVRHGEQLTPRNFWIGPK